MGTVPKVFDAWHKAYIEIAKTRQHGRLLTALFSGSVLSKFFLVRLVLALNIFSRNVTSRIRGKYAKQICHFSPEEFREFTSSF
jgi:hypothetical protein